MILSFTQPCDSGHPVESRKRLVDPCGVANAGVGKNIPLAIANILFGISEEICEYARATINETIVNNQNEFKIGCYQNTKAKVQ